MEENNINKIRGIMAKIFLATAFCILLLYVLINAFKFVRKPTDVFIIKEGKISSEEAFEGYVIRDEIVLEGENYKNGIVQIKNEGERVGKEENVFRYYSDGEEQLKKKIADLDEQISEAVENEPTIFSSDIEIIDKQIDSALEKLYKQNDIQKIKELKKAVSENITKKSKIAGELSASGSYINNLIQERSGYEEKLNSSSEIIKATESGIVSYRVDGYENILGHDDFSYLTSELLKGLDVKTGSLVENSNERGKIVNNFEGYIAIVGDTERALEAKVRK